MTRPSIGLLPTGRVQAMTQRFEELKTPPPFLPPNATDDSKIVSTSKSFKGREVVSSMRTSSPKCKQLTVRNNSPNLCSPNRKKPNTYQSSVASQLRKKYQHSVSEPASTDESAVKVPIKPPRTFAHDVYVQGREEIRILVDQKYRSGARSDENVSRQNRRRSRSADQSVDQCVVRRPASVMPYCNITDIFEPPSPVREIVKQSFSKSDVSHIFSDPADVCQEVEYARTMKRMRGQPVSHYSTLVSRPDGQPLPLCSFVAMCDLTDNSVKIHPVPKDESKHDFVLKFSNFPGTGEPFYWFAFTEPNFFYTYFMRQENRVISIFSELYSPRFFSLLMKTIAKESQIDQQLMRELTSQKIPLPGQKITMRGSVIEVPWHLPQVVKTKPSILLLRLEPEVIVKSLATLVQERKLAFVSSDPNLLMQASLSLLSLLYPLLWDYMFWPFVPDDLITFCAALSLPYFICLKKTQVIEFTSALEKRDEKMLIVDLDSRSVVQEKGTELKILPKAQTRSLIQALELCRNMTDCSGRIRDKAVEESFLEVWVQLLGPVTHHISSGSFCLKTLLKSVSCRQSRSFLTWFCETHLFDNFVSYWQVRTVHAKYVPVVNKIIDMDAFERKTESMRSEFRNRNLTPNKAKVVSGIGWNNAVIRTFEEKFNAISNKLKKHV